MQKARLLVIPILLVAAACGSDNGSNDSSNDSTNSSSETSQTSDGGGSSDNGLTADQQAAVEQLMSQEDAAQVFDRQCVEEKAAELSDEDAAAIAAAGPDGDPDLSADGEALTLELFDCFDNDALIDAFVDEMKSSGQSFDEDCVREGMQDFDLAELAQSGSSEEDIPPELLGALIGCFDLGGAGES